MTESNETVYLTLREAADRRIITCGLIAARKASQRPGFPPPAGLRNNAHVWTVSDLEAWQAGRLQVTPLADPVRESNGSGKSAVNVLAQQLGEEWKSWPGFSAYEASHRAQGLDGIRSVDRIGRDGRFRKGAPIKARVTSGPYPKVTLMGDDGERHTIDVHVAVLSAHAGPCPPGHEASHRHDNPLDNRWPEELAWETKSQNERRKFENGRPKPVPPRQVKHCILCNQEFTTSGRRCRPCRVNMGVEAAIMLRGGTPLGVVCDQLNYPAEGVFNLAVEFGGLLDPPAEPTPPPPSQPVRITLRDCLRMVTGRRGGDRP